MGEVHHLVHGGHHDGAGVLGLGSYGDPIANQRAGVRLRRFASFDAAPGQHQHDRFTGSARTAARCEEFRRTADFLAVNRDHPGSAVLSQKLKEIGALKASLIAGRDHVGDWKAKPVGGALEVTKQAAALTDEGDTSLDAAPRLAHVQHV